MGVTSRCEPIISRGVLESLIFMWPEVDWMLCICYIESIQCGSFRVWFINFVVPLKTIACCGLYNPPSGALIVSNQETSINRFQDGQVKGMEFDIFHLVQWNLYITDLLFLPY